MKKEYGATGSKKDFGTNKGSYFKTGVDNSGKDFGSFGGGPNSLNF